MAKTTALIRHRNKLFNLVRDCKYRMQIQRKSYFEINRTYFFPATIQRLPLLSSKENKELKNCFVGHKSWSRLFQLMFSVFILFLFSCNSKKFDSNKWSTKDDMTYPYRNSMLKDLTSNHKLAGLKYYQLINFLGRPNYKDDTSLAYIILEEYGSDIDPVYTKNLDFTFSKDSVITSFKIEEWKK